MFCRFAQWIVVVALISSVGGHWAFLQTAAWVGMTISYSKDTDISTALDKTFDGKHPCKLCKFVKEGKQAEQKFPAQLDTKKFDQFIASSAQFYFPPLRETAFSAFSLCSVRGESPPNPPPRIA